ncbi:MAG: Gfo/Idh/MocA family protein, partial [Acidimicrobiales bacterium]
YGINPQETAALAEVSKAEPMTELNRLLDVVDVVDVCTPTHTHARFALAAAAAAKHVICEKPLARHPEDAAAVVDACKRAGVKLLVGQVVRFFPDYVAVKELVDEGVIGKPAVLRLGRVTYLPTKGEGNWFHDVEKSGGLVYDLMIHDFDYARWVAGEVADVFCKQSGQQGTQIAQTHALAILRHESGAMSHIEGSWMYPRPIFRTRGEIAGSGGLVSWDSDTDAPLRLRKSTSTLGSGIPAPRSLLAESPWTTEIKHFALVLGSGVPSRVDGEDGLVAVRIAEAAVQSIATGERVEVAR